MNNNNEPWSFYTQVLFLLGVWLGFFISSLIMPIKGWCSSFIVAVEITYRVFKFGYIEKKGKGVK